MKTITSEIITNILDEMGVSYKVNKPRSGEFGFHDTMFMIRDKINLLYFTDFSLEVENLTYKISGDMFFLTPSGTLSSDWIKICESDFVISDYDDVFIITSNDDFDYIDLDEKIKKFMRLDDPKVKKVNSKDSDESDGRPLSDFLKSNIDIL
jgi:hypothetical protein